MPTRSTDATMDQIKKIYANWLEGTLAPEDALFQISDAIQTRDAAARTEAEGAPSTDDQ